jgi:anti-sigma factor RsiW
MGTLQQLQNNEAILVMYLANELEPEDRAEVEQMLAADSALRAELAQLQEAQNSVHHILQQMDATSSLPAGADSTARRISRLMKQRQLDLLSAEPLLTPRHRRHIPWWVYWVASAAAAVVAVVVWWGMQNPEVKLANSTSVSALSDDDIREQQEQVDLLRSTMANADDSGPSIADAENQAQLLLARRSEIEKPLSLSILATDEQAQ